MLRSYLRYRQFLFLWTGIVLAIYAFLQYLYWYPLESTGYTALIVLTLLVLISALDYRRYRRRLRQLDSLTEAWISLEREMRSLWHLSRHLTARADDNHAAPSQMPCGLRLSP